jgi:hypothetical protein
MSGHVCLQVSGLIVAAGRGERNQGTPVTLRVRFARYAPCGGGHNGYQVCMLLNG